MKFLRRRHRQQLPPTRLTLPDLVTESLAGLAQRPGRSLLTMLGTVLGVGAFVAVLGLTTTATGQISHSFNLLRDTTVTINDAGAGTATTNTMDFPAQADARLKQLNGVIAGGVWWTAPLRSPTIATTPDSSVQGTEDTGLPVYAASPGALAAAQPTVEQGELYNAFHQARGERVCILGTAAARQLGITRLNDQPVVFIDDHPYAVVGTISDIQQLPQFLLGIIIPTSTALADYGPPDAPGAQALIHTRIGAAGLTADQAPLALRPDQPSLLQAVPPPDPRTLRDQVNTDLSGLFLLLAAICLTVGAVGIANTTLVAVMERTGEIGLRRALGARPRHIAAQFLAESTALGALGGLIGTSLGVLAVLSTALAEHWTAILQPATVLPAPAIGAGVGLLAGLYPALRAARTEPLDALRR
ncbi:ABC transporter permease [Streptomyces sp. NPDC005374]|uniref:ABC transporter permease n=1 Tax=Streptomyces sp. NPDC005374 TaxID=3364713 RepID=UPI0036B6A45E